MRHGNWHALVRRGTRHGSRPAMVRCGMWFHASLRHVNGLRMLGCAFHRCYFHVLPMCGLHVHDRTQSRETHRCIFPHRYC
jgi:hypothetical protein